MWRYRIADGTSWRVFADDAVVYAANRAQTHLIEAGLADLLNALRAAGAPQTLTEIVDLMVSPGVPPNADGVPPTVDGGASAAEALAVLDELVGIGVLDRLSC